MWTYFYFLFFHMFTSGFEVICKVTSCLKGLVLVPKMTRVDWGAARKMGVHLRVDGSGVGHGMARLMGVAVAKAELNNNVHLCSNQGCTVDFDPKLINPAMLSVCVLLKVVVSRPRPS
jgi:hypothetical protein